MPQYKREITRFNSNTELVSVGIVHLQTKYGYELSLLLKELINLFSIPVSAPRRVRRCCLLSRKAGPISRMCYISKRHA